MLAPILLGFAMASSIALASSDKVKIVSTHRFGLPIARGASLFTFKSMSDDGRYIIFQSEGDHITGPSSRNTNDLFLKDTQTGELEQINLDASGRRMWVYSGTISGDGRTVAFTTYTGSISTGYHFQAYVRDRLLGTTTLASAAWSGGWADADCWADGLSRDGHYLVFTSWSATNLINDGIATGHHIYVRDLWAGTTERIDVSEDGAVGNGGYIDFSEISADGRFVSFCTDSNNLLPKTHFAIYRAVLKDRLTHKVIEVSAPTESNATLANESTVCANGRYVVYAQVSEDDTTQIWRFDRLKRTRELVSCTPSGLPSQYDSYRPVANNSGRYVLFASNAHDLVDQPTTSANLYLRDMEKGVTRRLGETLDGNEFPVDILGSISADGSYVSFAAAPQAMFPEAPGTQVLRRFLSRSDGA